MDCWSESTAGEYMKREKIIYGVKYAGIVLGSLAAGVWEGVYDAPCVVNLGVPVVSAMVGANAKCKKEYGGELGVVDGIEEKGFDALCTSLEGAVAGGGLSAVCEVVGYGLVKLIKFLS